MPLIPENQLSYTKLAYLNKTTIKTQLIYITVLFVICVALFSLPFIHVTISVKSLGAIQSTNERVDILAPISGRLSSVNIHDNQKVVKSAQLFLIDTTIQLEQTRFLTDRIAILNVLLKDIMQLLSMLGSPSLQSDLYNTSWKQYTIEIQKNNQIVNKNLLDYERATILLDKKVITLREFEQYKFEFEQSKADKELMIQNFRTQWQNDISRYQAEKKELNNQKRLINVLKKTYLIDAPIAGFIQNLAGLQVGSIVYANQKLAEISPETTLIANCYISPAGIGLIKKGQLVRFQIDAFNYNQWGLLSGRVIDISDDVLISNNGNFFKVKCQLSKHYLQLKNGYKGQIKKGMTFKASFSLATRSLYQLLQDKVMDWLNP